ncbi:MAG: phosphorylase [Candidatus Woesearchaeota archaeon]|nr:phosphorylase [Candidatus Woesearchaeota archaeon]MDN5327967.1 phosphorylase [Candidatus Woesearchaeota archaeon]
MKLKPKYIQISSGGPLVAILNLKDCEENDIHRGDRIQISSRSKSTVAIVDTTLDNDFIAQGEIGFTYELSKKISTKATVSVQPIGKPYSLNYIKKKLDGYELNDKEIFQIIKDIVDNKLSEVEIAYFAAAGYVRKFTFKETVALTEAMVNTGSILKLDSKIVLDKHCIGGVAGNRTTMLVVPILASLGFTIPKTSSRSITSPAGTADTMEVLANVALDLKDVKRVVKKTNGCIAWGGALSLAPADDAIIRVEHPLAIDAVGQMIASVLAKKKSVSSTHVLIDIPYGRGSKVDNLKKAKKLGDLFIAVGKKIGLKIKVVFTNGKEPIGNGIGPALEARDVLYVLTNHEKQPLDLREKALMLAGELIELATKRKNGYSLAKKALDSGLAYKKMVEIIKAQGKKVTKPEEIGLSQHYFDVKSDKSGVIKYLNNRLISDIALIAGAPKDKLAGVYLYKHTKHQIKKGETLFRVYAENKDKLNFAKEFYRRNKNKFFELK